MQSASAVHNEISPRFEGHNVRRNGFTAIATGIAAIVEFRSSGPDIAILCAPFIATFVTMSAALCIALMRQPKHKPAVSLSVPRRTFAR